MKVLEKAYVPKYRDAISTLETFDIITGERIILKSFDHLIEAPEWTRDGNYLIYNSLGRIYYFNLVTQQSIQIDTGFSDNCNNDHVLSPCQSKLAFSHNTSEDGLSRIYLTNVSEGTPFLLTPMAPSYLHSWSPDSNYLAYCAERNDKYDIYLIPSTGGREIKLTTDFGHNDGPEFSPCGQFIYFNSTHTGLMQIWKMRTDGSNRVQITTDSANHWFPHVSPDGKYLSCIVYAEGDVQPHEHPAHKNVSIKVIDIQDNRIIMQTALFGGQGSMNVNSWAPDNKRLAFVSYTPT